MLLLPFGGVVSYFLYPSLRFSSKSFKLEKHGKVTTGDLVDMGSLQAGTFSLRSFANPMLEKTHVLLSVCMLRKLC